MRRNWIKLYVDQILRGSMMDELTIEERWVWIGLLLLAGDSPLEGHVCITNRMGYTDDQISELIDVSIEIFQKAKEKMASDEIQKIEILDNNVIKIKKWKKYQSEYRRQRKYRESYNQKLQTKVIPENYSESDSVEERKKKEDIEEEYKEKEKIYKKEKSSYVGDKTETEIEKEFEDFWKFYKSIGNPQDDPGSKKEAMKEYKRLRRKHSMKKLANAGHGYADYLKYKKEYQGFHQRKKFATTWLRSDRWMEHEEFKYKAKL
jgi:hypothetical protein